MIRKIVFLTCMCIVSYMITSNITRSDVLYAGSPVVSCKSKGCPGNATCEGGGVNAGGQECVIICDDESKLICGHK